MKTPIYRTLGVISVALGVIGAFVAAGADNAFLDSCRLLFCPLAPGMGGEATGTSNSRACNPRLARSSGDILLLAKWLAGAMLLISAIGGWLLARRPTLLAGLDWVRRDAINVEPALVLNRHAWHR